MEHARRVRLVWCLPVSVAALLAVALPSASARSAHRPARHKPTPWKQVTRASWYGGKFQGRRTASGSRFNTQHLTAAHRTLNLGSKVRVTELRSGRSVVVQITDRGPFLPGRGIDLSYAAARQLGIVRRGIARVRIEVILPEAPLASPPVVTAMAGPPIAWFPRAIIE